MVAKLCVSMGRRIFRLLPLLFAGGFFFFSTLINDFFEEARDSFAIEFLLLVFFFVSTVAVAIAAIVGLLGGQKRSVVIRRFLFVILACLSFWFRYECFAFADRIFLSLNERSFRNKIEAAGGENATIILQWLSFGSSYKLFAYSGAHALSDSHPPLAEINEVFGGALDEMIGCQFLVMPLRDHFYVLHVGCP
jgi:hypothetical protein